MSVTIPRAEVAAELRRAIAGEVPVVCLSDLDWYDFNLTFRIGDWKISFFIDAGDLDYVDAAVAPDGRRAEFDDWANEPPEELLDPLDELSMENQRAIASILETASKAGGVTVGVAGE